METSRILRFSRQFGRFYAACFVPLLERTGWSMAEVHVLLFLANNPGLDTARDIVALRGLAKSQVSQAVERLTGQGQIVAPVPQFLLDEARQHLQHLRRRTAHTAGILGRAGQLALVCWETGAIIVVLLAGAAAGAASADEFFESGDCRIPG